MASLRMSGRQKKASAARALALVAAIAPGLGGCSWGDANPIEWYRHASGVDKNDLTDKDQRNQVNLEAGGQEPYPNLGTVPGPPDRAMSTVDLEKLQQGLVADRKNAQYSDEELRQGHDVPPLPGQAPPASAVLAQNTAAGSGQAAGAAPAASGAVPAPVQAAAPPHGAPTKGSAAPPQESSLASPSVRSVPEGQMPTAAPPPPTGVQPAQQQAPQLRPAPQQQAALPASPPAAPPPAALVPRPEPAVEPAVMRPSQGRHATVTLEAAEIGFGADGRTLSAEDRQRLSEVAKMQKEGGGSLRIIAYGRGGYGADAAREQLESFGEALDRANLVAQALTKLGVPANRITVQAAPEQVAGGVAGQAEILLDY